MLTLLPKRLATTARVLAGIFHGTCRRTLANDGTDEYYYASGADAVIGEDFAQRVEEGIKARRERWNPPSVD